MDGWMDGEIASEGEQEKREKGKEKECKSRKNNMEGKVEGGTGETEGKVKVKANNEITKDRERKEGIYTNEGRIEGREVKESI